jgi:predicted nuclease of predicted toxin-antitoxin system
MKLLFDENLSFKLCSMLADIFPISSQIKILQLESADDREIWDYAKKDNLCLVTQDSDFADMAALYGPPPKVIWLRCGNQPTRTIESILRNHSSAIYDFDEDALAGCLELS